MCTRFMAGKFNILWPICILCYALPLICQTFFGQIFLMLISIFKCMSESILYYGSTAECHIENWYYVTLPICCIGLIIQISLSYVTLSLYYQADFICETGDVIKKTNPVPDIIFLINKMLIIITFCFDKGKTSEHWPILIIVCITTGFNAYVTIRCQNFSNDIVKRLHYFFSLFLFWGFFCLLISNAFLAINFSGTLYFWIAGVVIIFIYCIFYVKTNLQFLTTNFSEIYTSYEFLNYINTFMKLIKEKEISRNSSIILTSFIEKVEEKCTNKKCVLKKYLNSLSKGFDSNFLLLQYAQKLFKIAISKLPMNITLRIHYIVFLASKINQKKNAQKELSSINLNNLILYSKFNIFRCKKFIEENASLLNNNKQSQDETDASDIFQEIEYKNKYKEFFKLLSKSSSLYYEFWSSLYTSHLQGTEDFRKLNDIGAELNIIIEQIEKIFQKLRDIKNNDLTILKLYESYLRNILNNEEKYEKYHKISNNLITDNKFDFEDKDYTNFDIKNITNNDEYQFLIISANDDNKGTIVNMSLNTCLYFGYTKDEIVGKNMCILIPELFHKIHIKLFNDTTEKIKTEFFEKLSNKITYNPEFMEFSGFGRNKLKYLVPLDMKIFFAQTEESDLVYIIDIMRKNFYFNNNNDLTETIDVDKNQFCCVLTDCNFIIQTFTSNCVETLGLDSKMINSNYDITNFIVQFNDELQNFMSNTNKEVSVHEASEIISAENSVRDIIVVGENINDKSFEYKLKKKKKLIKLKYSHQRKITWKVNSTKNMSSNNVKKQESGKILSQFSGLGNYQKKGLGDKSKKKFFMEVKEAILSNKHFGYYFYFKKSNSGGKEATLLNNNFDSVRMERMDSPGSNRGKMNKSSIKFYDEEEEQPKSNRIYNDDDSRNILGMNGFHNEAKKTVSNVSFDLDSNYFPAKKHESAKILSDFKDDNNDIIDEKFVPKCNFNFFLDLTNNSFKPTSTFENSKKVSENLRGQALEKINIVFQLKKKMNKKESSNSELSSKEDSSQSEVYSSSYIYTSSESNSKNEESKAKKPNEKTLIKKNSVIKNPNGNVTEKKPKEENIENQYYKVSISKIKFMIYDFNQEMVTTTKSEKKSQVELIIDSYKSRQNINITEDVNFSLFSFDKYLKDSKNKPDKNSSKTNLKNLHGKKTSTSDKNSVVDSEKEFEKEITYALSKQDEQNSIRYFYAISFIFILALLIIFISEIFFVIDYYKEFQKNLELIIDSINLRYNTNVAIFTIREMSLYNFPSVLEEISYNISDDNYDNYKSKIYSMSKNAFTSCNTYMENIIGGCQQFSEKTVNKLTNEEFNIVIAYGDNKRREIISTIFAAIIQVFSALCNMLQNAYVTVMSQNMFNFMYNSFNQVGTGLNIQIKLFIDELDIKWKKMIKIMIVYSVIYICFHILFYIMICKCFVSIAEKKASYISVFYGIDLSLIKTSIRKCEFFINKINQNEKSDKLNLIGEDNSTIASNSNFNLNSSLKQNIKDKKPKRLKKGKGIGKDKQTKRFKILVFIAFILSIIIFEIILLATNYFVIKFNQNSTYLNHLQHYHNTIFELFNAFREFLFDENNIISGMRVEEFLIKKQEEFYETNIEDLNQMYSLQGKIKGLTEALNDLMENGYCSYYISKFKSKEECEKYVGGDKGILSFGPTFMFNDFVEDLRYARSCFRLFLNFKAILGNLTDPTQDDAEEIREIIRNKPYKKVYRLDLFNYYIHERINVKFMNVLMQYILKERNVTMDLIKEDREGGYAMYIIFIAIYAAILIFTFWIYWIPMIRTLNVEIYKTKNMLSIIPVQILASLPNIRELLDISYKK